MLVPGFCSLSCRAHLWLASRRTSSQASGYLRLGSSRAVVSIALGFSGVVVGSSFGLVSFCI
jgi:hypothetical protein